MGIQYINASTSSITETENVNEIVLRHVQLQRGSRDDVLVRRLRIWEHRIVAFIARIMLSSEPVS